MCWQKSPFSNEVGSCVELATVDRAPQLRESDDPHLTAAATPKAGAFDRLGADA